MPFLTDSELELLSTAAFVIKSRVARLKVSYEIPAQQQDRAILHITDELPYMHFRSSITLELDKPENAEESLPRRKQAFLQWIENVLSRIVDADKKMEEVEADERKAQGVPEVGPIPVAPPAPASPAASPPVRPAGHKRKRQKLDKKPGNMPPVGLTVK